MTAPDTNAATLVERLTLVVVHMGERGWGEGKSIVDIFAEAAARITELEREKAALLAERDEARAEAETLDVMGEVGFRMTMENGEARDHWQARATAAEAQVARLTERVGELEGDAALRFEQAVAAAGSYQSNKAELHSQMFGMFEVLRPFATWLDKLDSEFADHEDDIIVAGRGDAVITFGDLRRARSVLHTTDANELRDPA